MFHRDIFLLPFLSLSLLFSPLVYTGEPNKNFDTLIRESGGSWSASMPNGDSTSINPIADMPKGPEINPNFSNNSSSSSGNSSSWGILGLFANLGKKSEKEKRMEDVGRAIDQALSKAQHGIPLNSADYAALGTSDLSNVQPTISLPKGPGTVFHAAEVHIPSSVPTAAVEAITAPLKISTHVGQSSSSIMPPVGGGGVFDRGSITCWPEFGEGGMAGVVQPTEIASTLSNIKAPKLPSLPGSKPSFPSIGGDGGGLPPMVGGIVPFPKIPKGPSGGDIATGLGGAAAGAGALMQAGGATAGGATAGGAAGGGAVAGGAAGGTVVTTGGGYTMAWFVSNVLPPVAIGTGIVATVGGLWALADYVDPTPTNVFFKDRYQDKLKREAAQKAVHDKSVGSNGGPNKNDDKKDRAGQIRDRKRWTNKEAREHAKALNKGFEEKKNPPGEIKGIGFTDGKKWISPDIDGHNGGVWKEFNLKGERIATLDKFLNKIKN